MLETKCVGDNFKMLVTVLAILVTNIHYFYALGSDIIIQKKSPTSKFSNQHPEAVTNFLSFYVSHNGIRFLNVKTWFQDNN